MNKHDLRIAIDGGAATGKSTVSKLVATKLGIRYINTGQMYRLFALIALKENIVNDEQAIYNVINNIDISFNDQGLITSTYIEFTPEQLESKDVSAYASKVAAMPLVRQVATLKQIEVGKEPGVLLEGRDIGTVIMTDATHKFFITVKPETAAKRRVMQHESQGESVDYDVILADILERNERDLTREVAPLMATPESTIIDSSDNTAIEIADMIVSEIEGDING